MALEAYHLPKHYLVRLVGLVSLVLWLNETNQMNQINQMNQTSAGTFTLKDCRRSSKENLDVGPE